VLMVAGSCQLLSVVKGRPREPLAMRFGPMFHK
jgi:hypothetical protein